MDPHFQRDIQEDSKNHVVPVFYSSDMFLNELITDSCRTLPQQTKNTPQKTNMTREKQPFQNACPI